MARRRKIRRQSKFFKYLTIFGASLGVLSSSTFIGFMAVDAVTGNFLTDEVRTYTANFYNEDVLIESITLPRGEEIVAPENPTHSIDGENNYFFIGWDTTGNGIPDYVPSRLYYTFDAHAVYLTTGKFDMSFLDLQNMDIEQLMDLLDKLNIDWEQFMDMFDIDPEMLMEWLAGQIVLSFEADASSYATYFRSTSLGDYNFKNKSFNAPDCYNPNLISPNSINPLSYTADLLHNMLTTSPSLLESYGISDEFGFVNYDITFAAVQDYYPVPDCEYQGTGLGENIDSDAHYLREPEDNKYQTEAVYCPALDDLVGLLRGMAPLLRTNKAISRDEKTYRDYAKSKYLSVPTEYEAKIDEIIKAHAWERGDYSQIESIATYVSHIGPWSQFKDGQINLSYRKNKDPVLEFLEYKEGTDLDFNTTGLMIFRRLGIPARMVKGYLLPFVQAGYNEVNMMYQHYWCEIYIDSVGWMICDCTNFEDIMGTTLYNDFDKNSNSIQGTKDLVSIEVTKAPNKTSYYIGQSVNMAGAVVKANYSDDTSSTIALDKLKISPTKFTTAGDDIVVTVSYTEGKTTRSDTFTVEVTDVPIREVIFNTDNVKKDFLPGETFTSEGITVTAIYENGEEADLDPKLIDVDSSAVNMAVSGFYTVQLSYEVNKTTWRGSYQISVFDYDVVALELAQVPDKLQYHAMEKFDPTGMIVNASLENGDVISVLGEQFSSTYKYANASRDGGREFLSIQGVTASDMKIENSNHAVTVSHTRPRDAVEFTSSFEIEILPNTMLGFHLINYKNNYRVGDYFDFEEFKKNAAVVGEFEYGDPAELEAIEINNVYLSTAPNLSSAGTVYFEVYYSAAGVGPLFTNVELNVSPVTEMKFSQSPSVLTSGPGTEMNPQQLFTVTTDYVGTMYLRSGTFTNYNTPTWSNEISNLSNTFVYNKATQYYDTRYADIHYLTNMEDRGAIPIYANSSTSAGSKTSGTLESYQFSTFELTYENYYRFMNYMGYDGSSLSMNYESAYSQAHTDAYLLDTSPTATQQLINDYIYARSFNSYGLIDKVLRVKQYMQNDFKYDINFSHASDQDPIYSFMNSYMQDMSGQGEGVCNTFASAATLIYRHLGIPARYVTGFGVYCNGGTSVVTTNNTHAWTEIWLDQIGWVAVDVTGYDDGHTIDGSATGNNYGQGFGGNADGGMYNFGRKQYSGVIELTGYSCDNRFNEYAGEYDIDYCNERYYNLVYPQYQPQDGTYIPDFLEVRVILVEPGKDNIYDSDPGTNIFDEHIYVPMIKVYDRYTGQDVTDFHNYTLAPGATGFSYYVNPIDISVYFQPQKSEYKINETVYFSVVITDGALASNNYYSINYVHGYISFANPGTYDYFGSDIKIVIYDSYTGQDVTDYYSIDPSYGSVVVRP